MIDSRTPIPAAPARGASPGGAAPRAIDVVMLGRVDYVEALEIQRARLEARAAGEVADAFLVCEHPPVITLGRGTCAEAATPEEIPLVRVERGGSATYHGPGQVVAYPIIGLREGERDLHRHLRRLEEAVIRTCADLGVATDRREGHTGVWTGDRKIASIGIAVKRWVTLHGLALNVDVDLRPFREFSPCGLDGRVMTSLAECGVPPGDLTHVPANLVRHLLSVFSE